MKIRKHFIFSGRVQGVGFRYRAYAAACELGLTGWVANLSDGNVEMEAQGEAERIDRLICRLQNSEWIQIDRVEQQQLSLKREKRFTIVN